MKKRHLWSYHNQIQDLVNRGSVVAFLMKGRINDFYKDYGIQIETIGKDLKRIQEENFVIENGMIKSEGEEKKPVYKEGKTQESYDKQLNEFLELGVLEKYSPLIIA